MLPQEKELPTARTYLSKDEESRQDSILSTDVFPLRAAPGTEDHLGGMSSPDTFISAREAFSPIKPTLTASSHKSAPASPLQKSVFKPSDLTLSHTQPEWPTSREGFVSWQPALKPKPNVQVSRPRATSSNPHDSATPSITAAYHQLHPRRMSALKTGDSLANAIVAGSLASSRAPSPTKLPPPIHPVHHSRSHHMFHRQASPSKKAPGMRQTLRKAPDDSSSASESEGDPYGKHKKKRHIHKHPNKHAEGDRKRWRDAVTERERKRYEGVWAANKGLLVEHTAEERDLLSAQPEDESACAEMRVTAAAAVSGIVVRDIWTRSRLPEHVLETIWDRGDGSKMGRLTKEEFVVGLWLISRTVQHSGRHRA